MESGDVDVPEEVLEGHSSRWKRLSDRWLVSLLLALAVVSAVAMVVRREPPASHKPEDGVR